MSEVVLVHDAVPGRARLRVRRMRAFPALAAVVESRIRQIPGVASATANAFTGSILAHFDPAVTGATDLCRAVEHALSDEPWSAGSETPASPPRPVSDVSTPPSGVLTPAQAPLPERLWHSQPAEAALRYFGSDPQRGLSPGQVSHRLGAAGHNEIPDIPRRPRSLILREQLFTVPGLMLAAAAGVSLTMGAVMDAAFIAGALAANAALGFLTEDQAEHTIQALRQVRTPQARVLREGRRTRVPIEQVAPGDILLLEPGHVTAADGRVIRSESLIMDESLLTGESHGQFKQADALAAPDAPVADRLNMVYAGSAVSSGKGAAVVTATGLATELGHIRSLVGEVLDTPPPMTRELQRLGGNLALLSVGVCTGVAGLGLALGLPAMEVLAITASLAVSAIPEGLPTVSTTTLALGMKQMRDRNVVIRRLPAVGALGSATVVCVDKTGTLTENRISVRRYVLDHRETEVAGQLVSGGIRCLRAGQPITPQDDPLLLMAMRIGSLCTAADLTLLPDGTWDAVGSATEQALLLTAVCAGIDVPRLRAELQIKERRDRSAGRNYMVTIHRNLDGGSEVLVKGAPEEVLALCSRHSADGATRRLSSREEARILKANQGLAAQGLRVLGLATCRIEPGEEWDGRHGKLTWVGLVGMDDPVRDGAREAIRQLRNAGIRTLMLTGDQPVTAASVGRAVGLGGAQGVRVADSSAIEKCLESGEPLPDVLARVSPEHKFEIVRLLQRRGHIVMMTGDGVNDAPALKAADIGVAMGARSTQVARDLADMILLDDDLASVPVAVSLGRTIFANIRKALRFLLASNMADIGLVAGALVFRMPFPLSALQLLWMNLLTDVFPALALSMEPPNPQVMDEPPRPPGEALLTPRLWKLIAREAGVISATTFASYLWATTRYGVGARARTVAFTTISMAEIAYALACRSEGPGVHPAGIGQNRYLVACLAASTLAQLATVSVPALRAILGLTTLSAVDWIVVGSGSALSLACITALKGLSPLPALGTGLPGAVPVGPAYSQGRMLGVEESR